MTYTLTAEELVLSLLLAGGADAAIAIKEEVFGGMSDEEMENRLDSATSGLLSKGLLVIRQNEEALAEEFKQFLLQQMNVPRVLRCQIADDDGGILTTSLYCGETYTIQQAFFNKRVHKMFRENDLAKISTYMNMSLDNQREESFVVKEFIFERIVDCLLRNEKISEEEASQFPAGFLEALEEKKGKLNTLFDYRFSNGQAEINSFLYVTKENQTWIIQQGNEDHLVIQPFSFAQFLQLTSTATNG